MIKLIIAGLCFLCLLNISAYAVPVNKPWRRRVRVVKGNNGKANCVDTCQSHGAKCITLKFKQ